MSNKNFPTKLTKGFTLNNITSFSKSFEELSAHVSKKMSGLTQIKEYLSHGNNHILYTASGESEPSHWEFSFMVQESLEHPFTPTFRMNDTGSFIITSKDTTWTGVFNPNTNQFEKNSIVNKKGVPFYPKNNKNTKKL